MVEVGHGSGANVTNIIAMYATVSALRLYVDPVNMSGDWRPRMKTVWEWPHDLTGRRPCTGLMAT